MAHSGVQAVKLEGGTAMIDSVCKIIAAGIPVVGHIGLVPQSVHKLGGYKIQGKPVPKPLSMQRA
ncbi:MAG: 3-methyl-2-oxobutanoate hydroxymethyltransferase [Bdellovibrionota bacterium]